MIILFRINNHKTLNLGQGTVKGTIWYVHPAKPQASLYIDARRYWVAKLSLGKIVIKLHGSAGKSEFCVFAKWNCQDVPLTVFQFNIYISQG